jgi:undecaprenyl-diphosphatase
MNDQIFFTLYGLAHKSAFFDKVIYFFADTLPYITVLAAIIFLLFHTEVISLKTTVNKDEMWNSFKVFKQKWKEIVIVFFSGVLAWIFAYVLKYLIHTKRPFDAFQQVTSLFPESGFAFPSGHATFFMALATALFFSHKKVGYIFVIVAILIGIARIIGGVHFPSDILGGFILGAITAYFVKFLYNKINK